MASRPRLGNERENWADIVARTYVGIAIVGGLFAVAFIALALGV